MDDRYVPGQVRDRFINALEGDDRVLCLALARDLTDCMNPLPGLVCVQLNLPSGSTYGTAARHVLTEFARSDSEGSSSA
jgi:hypothetical protein